MAEQWYFALPFLCTDFQVFSKISTELNNFLTNFSKTYLLFSPSELYFEKSEFLISANHKNEAGFLCLLILILKN